MDEDLVIRPGLVIPARELEWRFSRSGGPGGQSVNTTDSRVQLVFDLESSQSLPGHLKARALARLANRLHDGSLVVTASEQRSQWQNRQAAQRRMAAILREAVAPPSRSRRATAPTRASVERRLRSKKARGMTKRLRQGRAED